MNNRCQRVLGKEFNYASSDRTTLAARLTKAVGVRFENRNAPSWNTHQELVALAKFAEPDALSVSFTVANDITVYCRSKRLEPALVDAPENFARLNAFVYDLRGGPSSDTNPARAGGVKAWFARLFPRTNELVYAWRHGPDAGTAAAPAEGAAAGTYCGDEVGAIVASFLRNQTAMRQLSSARGARHIVVLQPFFGQHRSARREFSRMDLPEIEFRWKVVQAIRASDFCRQDCIDLTNWFDEHGGASHVRENPAKHYQQKIFVDEVHLTDTGLEQVAQALAPAVKAALSPR